jgi:hypothetical protein
MCSLEYVFQTYVGLDYRYKRCWRVGSSNELDNQINVGRCKMEQTMIRNNLCCQVG